MNLDKSKIVKICDDIKERLHDVHIHIFQDMDKPLLCISNRYRGVWLEHVYDSISYASHSKDGVSLAENTVRTFIDNMSSDGQYPCLIRDTEKNHPDRIAYTHVQECVSFAALCLKTYEMNGDLNFLKDCYEASKKWDDWIRRNRMTLGKGLVEMFVGYDTGHDNSGRLQGLSCPGRYRIDGQTVNASVLPEGDEVAPVIAVDMSCNLYATDTAIAQMADILGDKATAEEYRQKATEIKEKLMEICFDEKECFFFDVDKNGNKRRYLSSTILHLFMEGVLDPEEDKALINEIYTRHIKNPEEFWTAYPFPSMAINDPSIEGHAPLNCWGYYTQGNVALRTTLWMDRYGFSEDLDYICQTWLSAWTSYYGSFNMGQELDPITGEHTSCSEWYSTTMLFYLWAARRLGIIE